MKINLGNAVKFFFPNPSLEMVYYEAIANAIDAEATEIDVHIKIEAFGKPETFSVEITDNGRGFRDRNFEKFSNLLEIEEKDHKGVGRLVYINYFKKVEITSVFENKKRTFELTGTFDGENEVVDAIGQPDATKLIFKQYSKEKIRSYDYVKPAAIKKSILTHFYPLFYSYKVDNKDLKITVSLTTKEPNTQYDFYTDKKEIIVSQIPDLELTTFDAEGLDLFEKFNLYYSVQKNENMESSTITALCVDGRTLPVEVLSKGGIPKGHDIIFLLYSNLFTGKVNASRQELNMDESEIRSIKKIFGEKIAEILNEKIPAIQEANSKTTSSLVERYPHLNGFFEENSVGLIDRNQSLELAQKKFFNAQKEVLEASDITDEVYQKSLELSSRVLTEYVLYRNVIIEKLKKVDKNNSEADIHNLIVPQRSKLSKDTFHNDLFTNNAWLLDDKYMSYTTILSEKDMGEVLDTLTLDSEDKEKNIKRPDIAIIFSNDPTEGKKVDVVIVELKKLGLGLAKKEEVTSQLRQRARKLLQHYPDKIQRIWFYGIVDFDDEFKVSLLEDKYIELFSCGTVFYKEQPIIMDLETKTEIPVGLYVLSFDAFLKDAEVRNSTFLNLLKEELKANR
ncbi:ATP-binding protein [Mucilaginibacter sp.]|uniref:ATP-binding protein n=1 Tax=Mucilaginibacter sp. TaxID=1882438 RepID=UPI003266AA28